MAKILGYSGIITGAGITGVNSFTLGKTADEIETSVLGSQVKKFMAGATSFTLEAEGVSETPALAETFAVSEGNLKSFSIEGTCNAVEISAIGDLSDDDIPYKSYVAGMIEWTASLEMMFEGTVPAEGADYTFAGASAVITSVVIKADLGSLISASVSIRGKTTLPTVVNTAGNTISFELSTSAGGMAAGDAIVTKSSVSGSIGELIKYSISAQGTGELGLPTP